MTLAAHLPELQAIFPRVLFEAFNPNDKTNLAPYRFLHLAILIIVVARLIPIDAPGLQAAIWRPLVKCGQQSLEVFCVGIYLSFIASLILETTSDGVVARTPRRDRRPRDHDGGRLLQVMVEADGEAGRMPTALRRPRTSAVGSGPAAPEGAWAVAPEIGLSI